MRIHFKINKFKQCNSTYKLIKSDKTGYQTTMYVAYETLKTDHVCNMTKCNFFLEEININ